MSVSASVHIVTHTDARSEFVTDGYMDTGKQCTFGYSADGYSVSAVVADSCVTVTRVGSDGYVLTLDPNCDTSLCLGELTLPVHTDKLLTKVTETRIDVSATYSIGGDNNVTRIIIKVFAK